MEGTSDLVFALNHVKQNLGEAPVTAVLLAAAQPTAELMATNAPKITGAMARGIAARVLAESGHGVVTVGVGPHKDQWYARLVEFSRNPFLRATWDADEANLKERVRTGIGRLITEGAST
jgi:HK97 gp10 family phage protein